MKAIVCAAFGGPDVLKLEEVEKPLPKAGGRLRPSSP
jgi:NADPH:quinone reductase-like Zn-dependent oxidoreductase